MTVRYAVYYAPDERNPWWTFGAHWLGRDELRGADLSQTVLPGLDHDEVARITAHPRRYGFHATLKAPFRLQAGATADDLLARVQLLARTLQAVPLGGLVPVLMDGFVALVPSQAHPAVNTLAHACVAGLDDLRAPLNDADLVRRQAGQLDQRARELLERFGYPHVMERYRFHMSLTGPVDTAVAGKVVAQIARPVARLNAEAPPLLDRLCIFVELAPGAPFQRVADVGLGA